jgi:hypothetical protein
MGWAVPGQSRSLVSLFSEAVPEQPEQVERL